jgi:hypothetical protein
MTISQSLVQSLFHFDNFILWTTEKRHIALTAPLCYGGGSANITVMQLINSVRLDRLVHLIRHNAKPKTVISHFIAIKTNEN